MTKDGKFTIEDIKELTNATYPKQSARDIDGDWYDPNKYNRVAYANGLLLAFKISETFSSTDNK